MTAKCEWCNTPLRNLKGYLPSTGQHLGYCSKCQSDLWSKPIEHKTQLDILETILDDTGTRQTKFE